MGTVRDVDKKEATMNGVGRHEMDGTPDAAGVCDNNVTPGGEFTEDTTHGGPVETVTEAPPSMRRRRRRGRRCRCCKHVGNPDGVPADVT